jgi:hypothetical protein
MQAHDWVHKFPQFKLQGTLQATTYIAATFQAYAQVSTHACTHARMHACTHARMQKAANAVPVMGHSVICLNLLPMSNQRICLPLVLGISNSHQNSTREYQVTHQEKSGHTPGDIRIHTREDQVTHQEVLRSRTRKYQENSGYAPGDIRICQVTHQVISGHASKAP